MKKLLMGAFALTMMTGAAFAAGGVCFDRVVACGGVLRCPWCLAEQL